MSSIRFNRDVSDPDEPSGQVALRLREIVLDSDVPITKSADLKKRAHYAGSTLSEALNGTRKQSPNIIRGIVKACISDPAKAEKEIAALIAIIESGKSSKPQIVEKTPTLTEDDDDGPIDVKPVDESPTSGPTPGATSITNTSATTSSTNSTSTTGAKGDGPPIPPETPDDQAPTPPPRPRPHRRRLWLAAAAALIVLVAAASFGVYVLTHPTCGTNVARIDGQCIGVTDGSVTDLASDPDFTTVLGKIRDENAKVLADPATPVVSVAYVIPIPAFRQLVSRQFVRELEGAYVMQLQRNERGQNNVLGGTPRLQLLIANLGQDGRYQEQVVNRLGELADPQGRAPLVAVAGLDQSLDGVKDAIAGIGKLGIPMVGARITGDDVSSNPLSDGFFAVSPSVSSQVGTIINYLGPQPNVLIVEDRVGGDLYGPALAKKFREEFAKTPGAGSLPDPVPFNSGRAGAQAALNQVNAAVCTLRPRAVFYAGRGRNAGDLVRALGTRNCKDVAVNVVTSSDGHQLADSIRDEADTPNAEQTIAAGMNSNLTFVATAQAHPDQWRDPSLIPPGSHAVLDGDFSTAYPAQFAPRPGQPASIDRGGDTIMGHDALQVIVEAIARSRPPQTDDATQPVTRELVRQALDSITIYTPVYGASGPIYFRNAGYAVNKNTPFTTIDATGFIALGAPPARTG